MYPTKYDGQGYSWLLAVVSLPIVSSLIGQTRAERKGANSGDDKIVGGDNVTTTKHYFRHVVSLQIKEYNATQAPWTLLCGGSIFTPLYVITACHCVARYNNVTGFIDTLEKSYSLDRWKFTAGTSNMLEDQSNMQSRGPVSVQYHPSCDPRRKAYDVAVAEMDKPFIFNAYVAQAEIYSWDREMFESRLDRLIFHSLLDQPAPCFIAGFGSTKRKSLAEAFGETATTASPRPLKDPGQLKKLELYPMYEGKCLLKLVLAVKAEVPSKIHWDSFVDTYGKVFHNQICVQSKYSNESSCLGDGGSGLVCDGYLVGIESWNLGCGAGDPDMFQNMLTVLSWVKRKVCRLQSCQDARYMRADCYPQFVVQDYLDRNCAGKTTTDPRKIVL